MSCEKTLCQRLKELEGARGEYTFTKGDTFMTSDQLIQSLINFGLVGRLNDNNKIEFKTLHDFNIIWDAWRED